MQMEDENQFGYDEEGQEPELQDESELPNEQEEEELPDSLPEESMVEEEEEEPKPKKRDKAQTRINEIQREKYQALHEAERLRKENSRLKEMWEVSTKAAMSQSEKNVLSRVEQARRSKIEANESGDSSLMADADMELADSVAALREHNNHKMQAEFYEKQRAEELQQEAQQYIPENPYQPYQHEVQDWLQDNDWINPNSRNYDQEKAVAVDGWTAQLNQALQQQGLGNHIGSPSYLAEVEEQARLYDNYRQQNQPQRRDLNMKSSRGGASPTRTNMGAQVQQRQTHQLTTEERDMAKRMGVSEKEMLQQVIRDKQVNAIKRRGGY